jgi:hypothetical protein
MQRHHIAPSLAISILQQMTLFGTPFFAYLAIFSHFLTPSADRMFDSHNDRMVVAMSYT